MSKYFNLCLQTRCNQFSPHRLTAPNYDEQPVHIFPQDIVLKELLTIHPKTIFKYHEHDSLLENKVEEELTEQERLEAWQEFRREQSKLTKEEVANPGVDEAGNPTHNISDLSVEGLLGAMDSNISEPIDLSQENTTASPSEVAAGILTAMKRKSTEMVGASSSKKSKD